MKHFAAALLTALALRLRAHGIRRRGLDPQDIAERLPDFPKIDEVSKTPIAGIYELRIGTDIYYTDEQGNHLIEGQLIDTRRAPTSPKTRDRQAHRDRLLAACR